MAKHDQYYIDLAHVTSWQSHDEEIKVGSLLVKDGQILSQGWNGTPTGMDNSTRHPTGATKKEVIHSEANTLMKLARNGGGSEGATLFSTHSPCWECAKLLLQAGVKRICYTHDYDMQSIFFMKERGLELDSVKPSDRLLAGEGSESKSEQSQSKHRSRTNKALS